MFQCKTNLHFQAYCSLLLIWLSLFIISAETRNTRHIGGDTPHHHHHHHEQQLDADDPDFSGIVDFSNAIPGPGGSWCITKTKYVDHMVKDQIKECWHQNVTQCHDTYVTEFLPSQEQKCEESFWKSCKIDFREMPYNYTMKQCHTPMQKMCDGSPQYGKPNVVCKTWFESECNTTYAETTPNVEDKPSTWCKKVPRKICAPDNCKIIPGVEECHDKMLVSTVQKPTEICDLQPQQHCRLITKLTPHLISKEVCKNIPKEVCHLALTAPKQVRKPVTLKWCTRKKSHIEQHRQYQQQQQQQQQQQIPTYKSRAPGSSYLPPPPQTSTRRQTSSISSSTSTKSSSSKSSASSPPPPPPPVTVTSAPNYPPPSYPSPGNRIRPNFNIRSDSPEAVQALPITKFKPLKRVEKEALIEEQQQEELKAAEEPFKPVFQDQFRPLLRRNSGPQHLQQLPASFKAQVEEAGLLAKEKLRKELLESGEAVDISEEDLELLEVDFDHVVGITDDLGEEGDFVSGVFEQPNSYLR